MSETKRRRPIVVKTILLLKLTKENATMEAVSKLPGLQGLRIDKGYGVVYSVPRESLYAIRVVNLDNLDARKRLSPEIMS